MPVKRRYLSPREEATVIERQSRKCACGCGEDLEPGDIQFDHYEELWTGDENNPEDYKRLNHIDNFRALKTRHHLVKTNQQTKQRAKEARQRAKDQGTYLNAKARELARIMGRTKQIGE